jgi:acetyl-CoA acetyltransferase
VEQDIAIVGYAQSPSWRAADLTEPQFLFPVISDAIERAGVERREIGFTCAGSCDYLSGQTFAFVMNLEAVGAWPPISESHVEMDGAWALYEAWVRLQEGDIDIALAFSSGLSTHGPLREVLTLQLDPYYLSPLWLDSISAAALQAQALIDSGTASEADFADVASRSRRNALANPNAQVAIDVDADQLLKEPYLVAPLRKHDCPPISDGAAAAILVAGDRARELCERPAWIRGIDHRTDAHYLGMRDLATSPSTAIAAKRAGVTNGDVEVAELSAPFSHQELILRDAIGLGDGVDVNPSGGLLGGNPMMVAGLVRIGEAARQISQLGKHRVLAHATSGPCLQQNLVCVLEGD